MKRLKRFLLVLFALIFAVALPVLSFPRETKAYSEDNDAWKKAMGTAIRQCYDADVMQSPLTLDEYDFNHSALWGGETWVQVPNLNGNYNTMKCYELINKYVQWASGDPATESAFLTDKLGYTKNNTGQSSGECFYFTYTYEYDDGKKDSSVPTDYICADTINSDGTIGVDKMTIRSTSHDYGGSSFNVEWENGKGKITVDCHVQNIGGVAGSVSFTKGSTKWSQFKTDIQNTLLNSGTCVHDRHGSLLGGYDMYLNVDFLGTEAYGDVKSTFEIKDKSAAAAKATNYMLGQTYNSNPSFSKTDTFSMYQAYVTEYYKADIRCSDNMSDNQKTALKSQGYVDVAIFNGSKIDKNCYAKAGEHAKDQSSGAEGTFGDYRTFEQICAWLAANTSGIDTSKLTGASSKDPDDHSKDDDKKDDKDNPDDSDSDEEKCYQNAQSLGWVICPVIYGLRDMTEHLYGAIEPFLQVNKSIIGQLADSSDDSGLFKSWRIFRDIANVVFTIAFLIVILSQLTGFGIDNYGIKRMLPKLILTAILVNLSFIICAIAVDISNILGVSLKDLFEHIAKEIGGSGLGDTSSDAIGIIVQKAVGFIAAIGTAGAAFAVGVALTHWAILVPILLFLLTVAISAFFALVVLSLRQALITILIVISPLAFACMILPNTEGLLKKWWSAAKGMLAVYPIIGAIIGAGYLTANILMSSDQGFFMVLASGILMVAPYFMIPSLTRKSLDAIGGLGAKIGNVGSGISRGARNGINNSEAVKNFKADQAANAKFRRVNGRLSRALDEATLKSAEKNKGRKGAGAWIARHTIASNGRLRAAQRNNEARVNTSRDTVLQASQAAAANRSRMENGGYATRAENLRNQALEDSIKDQSAAWENDGTFGSDSRFEQAVYEAMTGDGDDAALEALMRKATNGSDGQREALRKGADRAFAEGGVKESIASRFGAHIANNSIYKSQNRSMHDQATAINKAVGNGGYSTAAGEYVNSKFVSKAMKEGKQAAASAFNYDDGEFHALMEKAKKGTTEERRAIAEFMDQAQYLKANDTTGQYNNVKPEAMQNIADIKAAALAGGGFSESDIKYTPESLRVDHSADSTPPAQTEAAQTAGANTATVNANATQEAVRARQSLDTYTENVIRRVENTSSNINDPKNGGLSAEEGERLIRRAEERYNQKYGNAGGTTGGNKGSNAGGEQA